MVLGATRRGCECALPGDLCVHVGSILEHNTDDRDVRWRGIRAAWAAPPVLLTPLVAQYLIHISLPLALSVYAVLCYLCVACLRAIPSDVSRPAHATPSTMMRIQRYFWLL